MTFSPNTEYPAIIGAGGNSSTDGGETSLLGITAAGGKCGWYNPVGGDGGSGGGAGGYRGGTDGADGKGQKDNSDYYGGSGQGTTTRPFGDTSAEPAYSAGGDGGVSSNTIAAKPANTGNGGDGPYAGWKDGAAGGSGIIIVRWRF